MSSQQSTYTANGYADFSTALMQATAFDQSSVKRNLNKEYSKVSGQNQEEYDPYNNRNLSSVITRIRDEGPATSRLNDCDRHDPAQTGVSAAVNRDSGQTPPETIRSGENDQHATSEYFSLDGNVPDKYAVKKKNPEWQQLVLILFVAVLAVMGYLLYQLKTQTDEMKQVLRLNEEQILLASSAHKQSTEVVPRLTSLSEALVDLREELKVIKSDFQQSDSRLAVNIPRELKPELMKIAAASEGVGSLQNEFARIQQEVRDMGAEIKILKNETVAEKAKVLDSNWVVNLASLSSKDKAQAAFDKLQKSTASPLMQEVIVNGKKMYRISAEGFSTPEEATAFITEARERYGFEGGWIKQLGTHIAGI